MRGPYLASPGRGAPAAGVEAPARGWLGAVVALGAGEELDVGGDDLVLGARRAVVGLPLLVVQAPGDGDLAALGEVLRARLGQGVPDGDVDVDRVGVAIAAVDGEAQSADGLARRGLAELGVAGQAADQLDGVHLVPLLVGSDG